MDGENKGKPYEQMDDLGVPPIFLGSTPIVTGKGDNPNDIYSFNAEAQRCGVWMMTPNGHNQQLHSLHSFKTQFAQDE